MTMNAAVLEDVGRLRLRRVRRPEPGPGEVVLKIEANTICGTDLRIVSGAKTAGVRPGVILGHEFAGRVAAVGDGVAGVPVGAQATCSIVVGCLRCAACQSGREHLCENLILFGYELDGGLAEYLLVPRVAMEHGNLVVVERELPATTLALAEPVSCCLNGARQVAVAPGETVVVLGAGPIGLLHIALARLAGATIFATGRPGRLEAALSLGATEAFDLTGDALTREIMQRTGGRGADVVIVAVGDLSLVNQALELAAFGGRVNYFAGFPKGSAATMDPNLIHYRELLVSGGSNARRADVARAVGLLSSGALDVGSMVTHQFPLSELDEAMAAVRQRRGLKVAVVPDEVMAG
ncbi:alcohol dehydrogenase catalytic domain-containing protein [Arachnia rubra]|jgi:Threonine dehydrogenase and related Zn-dependent dehydrogenases|uniref:Alcohol dehydrogenase catalytic domain-containing protein n=1 Tax=Arachnia rubra TaxID=1547448 RepID=A0ABX7Y558_9ACTN|nr:alcohol dehydrogenase catalytic domain-containing protein [Arachnia rubra]MDO4646929.1 alcohol dehydrogenase catalytic domain-containing protein [Propionibacteriaceae bacterium]QUC08335.1 alcohol dehydrogenase catalytic domain-containing protein [Arachnia rubra]